MTSSPWPPHETTHREIIHGPAGPQRNSGLRHSFSLIWFFCACSALASLSCWQRRTKQWHKSDVTFLFSFARWPLDPMGFTPWSSASLHPTLLESSSRVSGPNLSLFHARFAERHPVTWIGGSDEQSKFGILDQCQWLLDKQTLEHHLQYIWHAYMLSLMIFHDPTVPAAIFPWQPELPGKLCSVLSSWSCRWAANCSVKSHSFNPSSYLICTIFNTYTDFRTALLHACDRLVVF